MPPLAPDLGIQYSGGQTPASSLPGPRVQPAGVQPPAEIRSTGRLPTNGVVWFTIFQALVTARGRDGKRGSHLGDFPREYFDFLLLGAGRRGEANRVSTSAGILEYFAPDVGLGLATTPNRTKHADSYACCGDAVVEHWLPDGINEPYLIPVGVQKRATTLDGYVCPPDDTMENEAMETGGRHTDGGRAAMMKHTGNPLGVGALFGEWGCTPLAAALDLPVFESAARSVAPLWGPSMGVDVSGGPFPGRQSP